MKQIFFLCSFFLSSAICYAQASTTNISDSIVKEGIMLYHLEKASWHGTDIFLESFKEKKNRIQGYFSYEENNRFHCIFFSKDETPVVLGRISFNENFKLDEAIKEGKERELSALEQKIYLLRKTALDQIRTDTFFTSYNNTNFNIIPIVGKNGNKVYVLTGTSIKKTVLFGNDYLLSYNINNVLLDKRMLHQNLIPVDYGKQNENGELIVGSLHNHSAATGQFITATDICTLMLYQNLTKWEQHIVVSEKYASIWNCENNTLTVVDRAVWEQKN